MLHSSLVILGDGDGCIFPSLFWRTSTARWLFHIFFMFTPIWGRFPFWLIFFKGVGNHQLDSTRRWWISTHQLRSWCTKKPTSSSHGELLGRVRQRHNFKALGMRIYMNLLYAIVSKSRNGAIHHFLSGHECHQGFWRSSQIWFKFTLQPMSYSTPR